MVNNQINILLLGGAKRVSLAERFIASAKTLGYEVNIFSYELEKYVPILAVGEVIVGLRWKDEKIFEHLTQIIHQKNIHIVLPFLDAATITAAILKDKLKDKHIFFPVSDENVCTAFFNKSNANQWFINHGFPVPHQNLQDFPLIAKPINGSASQGIQKLENQAELVDFLLKYEPEKYLIQQFIEGDEYSVDCYVDDFGETLSIIPRKRIETIGGEVSKSVTKRLENLIEISAEIIKKANFRGPITIQFLQKKSQAYLMEINPRFGGGVITSIEAGGDIPMMILKDFLKIKNEKVNDWKENLLMMRTNREFFFEIT